MALNNPIEAYLQAAQAREQNRLNAINAAQQTGQNLGQLGMTAATAVDTLKKKQLLQQLVQAMATQGAPSQGPQMPTGPAIQGPQGYVPPGAGGNAVPAGQFPMPKNPMSGIGAPAQDNTQQIQGIMTQLYPEEMIKSMVPPNALQQSEIFKNYARGLGAGKDTKRTYQPRDFMDAQGRTIVGRFDTATGEPEIKDPSGKWVPVAPGTLRGFAPQFRTDNTTGGTMRTSANGEAYPVSSPNIAGGSPNPEDALVNLRVIAPKLADRFSEILSETQPDKNKFLEQNITASSSASQVKSILKDPNPSQVGLQSLGFHFARMSGSNSQLSDREREVFEQPLSLISKVVNKGYRLGAGDLSPMMRRDLLRLSDLISQKSTIQAQKIISAKKKQASRELGRYYTKGLDSSFPNLKDLTVTGQEMLDQSGSGGNSDLSGMSDDELRRIAAGGK